MNDKIKLSFWGMHQMSNEALANMKTKLSPNSEESRMIDYELRIRKVELPDYLKLKN